MVRVEGSSSAGARVGDPLARRDRIATAARRRARYSVRQARGKLPRRRGAHVCVRRARDVQRQHENGNEPRSFHGLPLAPELRVRARAVCERRGTPANLLHQSPHVPRLPPEGPPAMRPQRANLERDAGSAFRPPDPDQVAREHRQVRASPTASGRIDRSRGWRRHAQNPRMPEERKLVSLVFADVVGSTAWGAQQDAEFVRRSMARYFARMKDIAETHGGTVEKFIGDAVMVVFGVPQLHEDDAERAVRAALAMRDAIADLNRDLGIALAVRIAVNSGDVVTGDGEDQRQFLVTGDAVNVVARLQAGAEPDEVVVGAHTERLTRDSIEYEARHPIVAKGKPEPVPAFRALRARSAVPVSHGGAPAVPATLVGRARELRQLLDGVERATDERTGYLVTVIGNAGVGKSRLVAEVMARLALREGVRILRGRCLAYGAGITYWPLMDVVREDAGITSSDDRGAVLGKLSARVATLFSGDRLPAVQARIALLLSLEPAAAVLPNVSAARIAVELSWGIRQYLEAIAAHETLVVVIDDLQWAEPAVLEVLGQVADRASAVPVLLVCIARPELLERHPSWAASRSNASLVHLEPLDEPDTRSLLSGLLATADVPPPVASLIAERSAGNPLFCEEFLRMLIDAGHLEFADGRWKTTRSLGALPLPESIQSIVAARLDGLPPTEKITFQRASVIGELFALDELLALDGEMGVAPEALVRKGLFVADRDDPSGRSLRFKHLLIRDVAYGSLSKADRATLHDRVAALLEAGKADRREGVSELLAHP